jgi:hypothetical protein
MANEHEQQNEHGKKITIRIDHKVYTAPKPAMTGIELRQLAQPNIGADYDLWLENPGPDDDIKVGDDQAIDLKSGMHFYSSPATINPGACHGPAR